MAEQAFGIKKFELIGGGTPTISSPNNLPSSVPKTYKFLPLI